MGRGPGVRAVGQSIQIDFQHQGRCRERLRLEPTPRNLRYAKRLKATIDHEIATGTFDYAKHFPNSKRVAQRSSLLRHALGRFLERAKVTPETLEEYEEYVRLVPTWLKDKAMAAITQADLEKWLDGLDVTRKRQNNLLIPIRGAFRKAQRNGEIKINPVIGLKTEARKSEAEIDPFSRDEVGALSETAHGRIWSFWAWTGVRSGELAGLDWRDVEPAGDAVEIRRAVRVGREKGPKTRAGVRRLVLLQPARDALGDRGQGRVFLNPATGEPFQTDKQIREAFRKACVAAGVRYRYPYQLRHTWASWALSSGENPMWVAKCMGHKNVAMVLKVYGRYIPELDPLAGTRMVKTAIELPYPHQPIPTYRH